MACGRPPTRRVAAGRGHHHVEIGVTGAQPQELDAGVARRPDHADLHDGAGPSWAPTMGRRGRRSPCSFCNYMRFPHEYANYADSVPMPPAACHAMGLATPGAPTGRC